MRHYLSAIDRLIASSMPEPNSGCTLWLGRLDKKGYGQIYIQAGKSNRAHRFAYEVETGPIPEGLVIDHLCRNPSCVNPAHMEAVTSKVNTLRGNSPAAIRARANECRLGHPFSEENTYRYPTGGARKCRTCRDASHARVLQRKHEVRATLPPKLPVDRNTRRRELWKVYAHNRRLIEASQQAITAIESATSDDLSGLVDAVLQLREALNYDYQPSARYPTSGQSHPTPGGPAHLTTDNT